MKKSVLTLKTTVTPRNEQRRFPVGVAEKLDTYVYALKDPRDGKVFYIGQGQGDRVFEHFDAAQKCLEGERLADLSKTLRIIDIWMNDEDVEWFILAHKLTSTEADKVEAACIDLLVEAQEDAPLNEIKAPHSSFLDEAALADLQVQPVNPDKPMKIFVFPIHRALKEHGDIYQATRHCWQVKEEYRNAEQYPYVVGLAGGVSRGAYYIEGWNHVSGRHYEFTGKEFPALIAQDWRKIVSVARGYWKRGNFLITEFDGQGKFRILRGANENTRWFDCIIFGETSSI
jgi:hypothetical protein